MAAVAIGLLGARARDRNSIIGVLMPFGLGLGILFLALYPGRGANKFGLLTGQIIAVDDPQLGWLIVIVARRPRRSAGDLAAVDVRQPRPRGRRRARGPGAGGVARLHDPLGLIVAVAVQIVGALLVLALLVTPAAAAARVSASPVVVPLLSVAFGVLAAVGGILLALGGSLPISPYITTVSFAIYLVCRLVGRVRYCATV